MARSPARICVRQGRTKVKFIKNKDFKILRARTIARVVLAFFLLGNLSGRRTRVFKETGESIHRLAAQSASLGG